MFKKNNMKIASIGLTLLLLSTQSFANNKTIIDKKLTDQELINIVKEKKLQYPFYETGLSYLKNEIIQMDNKKAIFWLKKSSEIEKYNQADLLLAELYLNGLTDQGLNKPDYKSAEYYFKKSALGGNKLAELKLSLLFIYNEKMLNPNAGYSLLIGLAKDGNEIANLIIGLSKTKKENATALNNLKDYYISRSKNNDANSSFILGFMYMTGKGTNRDFNKALMYFNKSREQGNKIADIFENQIEKIIKLEAKEKNNIIDNKKVEKKVKND